jgi:hypothetical protein
MFVPIHTAQARFIMDGVTVILGTTVNGPEIDFVIGPYSREWIGRIDLPGNCLSTFFKSLSVNIPTYWH